MLETSIIKGTSVVSVTIEGSISADEDDAAQQAIANIAAERGKAQMLSDYVDIDWSYVEPKAVWEDVKGAGLLDDVDRIGVVANSGMLDKLVEAMGKVSDVQVRTFDGDQRNAAVAWLSS